MRLKLSTCLISLISDINNGLSIQTCNWCCKHEGEVSGDSVLTLPTEFLVDWEVQTTKGYCVERDFRYFEMLCYHWSFPFFISQVLGEILATNVLNKIGLSGNCFK